MTEGFTIDIKSKYDELDDLKKIVQASHQSPIISASVDGFDAAETIYLCGVRTNGSLVSFAWCMKRHWVINYEIYIGLSIGLVTTDPRHRNSGYARSLIKGIENHARLNQVDFLYLAGIPGFYDKYGYIGFAPKSKFIFSSADLPKRNGRIVDATIYHLPVIQSLYNDYSSTIESFSYRKYSDWQDLFGPLSSTFLFYCPKLVLDQADKPIAYFCSTPNDVKAIREFIPALDSDSVTTALSLIANSPEYAHRDSIEIFAPAKGPIWNIANDRLGADFQCFIRPRSSNMLKWLSSSESRALFSCNFLLQGDLL